MLSSRELYVFVEIISRCEPDCHSTCSCSCKSRKVAIVAACLHVHYDPHACGRHSTSYTLHACSGGTHNQSRVISPLYLLPRVSASSFVITSCCFLHHCGPCQCRVWQSNLFSGTTIPDQDNGTTIPLSRRTMVQLFLSRTMVQQLGQWYSIIPHQDWN